MHILRRLERHKFQPPDRTLVVRTISMISKSNSSTPRAATPPISSTAKVKDTDMAGSLAGCGVVVGDLHQAALHDRAGGDVGPAASDRPAVQRRSCLDIPHALIEGPGPRIVVLDRHSRHRPTMIDDLLLQGSDQRCSGSQ